MNTITIAALIAGTWNLVNGILHDVFVLISEKGKKYDRELLRLLLDGHILIMCGAFILIACLGLRTNTPWAFYMTGAIAISMLIYCALIFPFLKSIGTLLVNLLLLVLLVYYFPQKA